MKNKRKRTQNPATPTQQAVETIAQIDEVGIGLKNHQFRLVRVKDRWEQGVRRLDRIEDKQGQSEESASLRSVALQRIDTLGEEIETLEHKLERLRELRARTQKVQTSFELYNDTRLLVELSGVDSAMRSPDETILEIRKSVYALEGRQELM